MADSPVAGLRQTLIDIDRRLLEMLTPHAPLDHAQLEKVAALEQARNAAQRLLFSEEADELKRLKNDS